MTVELPELCLVLVLGPTGSGKSTFAARHFDPREVVSLEELRAKVCEDPAEIDARGEGVAHRVAEAIVDERLRRGMLTVVDGAEQLDGLLTVARKRYVDVVGLFLDTKVKVCLKRTPGLEREALVAQRNALNSELAGLRKRKGASVHSLLGREVDGLELRRVPMPGDRSELPGPFDLIGDVHGCHEELVVLLTALGYRSDGAGEWGHPERTAVFVGDLVDRGPRSLESLDLVRRMVEAGRALCVLGNHDDKLNRYLSGRKIKVQHGLATTVAELEQLEPEERAAWIERARAFLDGLPTQLQLDGGCLVVAHGGIRESMIGRVGSRVRAFCLYGDTTGKLNAFGLPERLDWAQEYEGDPIVVYGHTPNLQPRWVNGTTNIDQGCCFGGALTAFRYPEGQFAMVPARRTYCPPRGGFSPRVLPPAVGDGGDDLLPLDPP